MSDDNLRMTASVTDKASGPLKEIQRSLHAVAKTRSFSELRRELHAVDLLMKGVAREARTVLVPAFGAVGLAGGGIVASLIGVGAALRSFSQGAVDLHYFSKETQASARSIKEWERVAARMNLAPEEARGTILSLTDSLRDLQKRADSPVYEGLIRHGAANLAEQLRAKVRGGDMDGAIREVQAHMDKLKDPLARAEFSKIFTGGRALERMGLKEYLEVLGKLKPVTEQDARAAMQFEHQMLDLGDALRGLKHDIGNELLPTFTVMALEFREFVKGEAGKEFKRTIIELGLELRRIDWNEVGRGVKLVGGEIGATLRDLSKLIQEIRKLSSGDLSPLELSIIEGSPAAKLRDALRATVPTMDERTSTQRGQIADRRAAIAEVEARMKGFDKETTAYKRLDERRESLTRSLHDLEEGLRKLEREMNDAAGQAKKMNFMGPAGGGPIIVPAALGGPAGGGGSGGFRAGGFRSGSYSLNGSRGADGNPVSFPSTGGPGGLPGPAGAPTDAPPSGGGLTGGPGAPGASGPRQRFATAPPGGSGSEGSPTGRNLGGTGRLHDLSSVPTPVLDQAKKLLQRGGSTGELQRFMAGEGYPKSGNWCGEFAASVVRASGGDPPKGAAVASNWMKWGQHIDAENAKPGDIAVRKRSRFGGMAVPGQTGSHVGLVDSIDPKTGRFNLLGGNQGRPIVPHGLNEYEFRRGPLNIDRALANQSGALKGSASIKVDVNAPKGTRVGVDADGLFKDVQMRRAPQMPAAPAGGSGPEWGSAE